MVTCFVRTQLPLFTVDTTFNYFFTLRKSKTIFDIEVSNYLAKMRQMDNSDAVINFEII